ncbi:MAG: TerB family tellurite resistance protein [Deltaproteobacteria bacterium]|nr:TerB family tellurite resistance protein [Deltaproteobacteria bacterium]
MTTKNETIADILMGAAYADNELDGREYETVKELLAKVMNLDTIPEEMESRIGGFDPTSFDLTSAAKSLGLDNDDEKRHLVELIAAVADADEILDFAESDYLADVATALELPRQTYTDLTVEILSVENLQDVGKKLITPPPIPDAAK